MIALIVRLGKSSRWGISGIDHTNILIALPSHSISFSAGIIALTGDAIDRKGITVDSLSNAVFSIQQYLGRSIALLPASMSSLSRSIESLPDNGSSRWFNAISWSFNHITW